MPTVTLAELEEKVWATLDNNRLEFPEPTVRAAINECLFRVNIACGFSQALVPISGGTVLNQHVYSRPAGILIPIRVDFNKVELQRISLRRLARKYPNFSTDTGEPTRWAAIGLRKFVLHPGDSVGGATLEMSGVAPLTPLVLPSQTVTLEDQFVDMLLNYARPRLLLKEGGKALADAVQSYKAMMGQMQTLTLWRSLVLPRYGLAVEQQTSDGKGL